MLVKRKGSAKRGRKVYKALEFDFSTDRVELDRFLGGLGKVRYRIRDNLVCGLYIETKDRRRICVNQILLKDDRKNKILSFDSTIFYDWFVDV